MNLKVLLHTTFHQTVSNNREVKKVITKIAQNL